MAVNNNLQQTFAPIVWWKVLTIISKAIKMGNIRQWALRPGENISFTKDGISQSLHGSLFNITDF